MALSPAIKIYFSFFSSCFKDLTFLIGTNPTFNSYPIADANLMSVNKDGKFFTSSLQASKRETAGFLVCIISATSSCVIFLLILAFLNFIARSICNLVASYIASVSVSTKTSFRNLSSRGTGLYAMAFYLFHAFYSQIQFFFGRCFSLFNKNMKYDNGIFRNSTKHSSCNTLLSFGTNFIQPFSHCPSKGKTKIRTVFQHLIHNSFKFSFNGFGQ